MNKPSFFLFTLTIILCGCSTGKNIKNIPDAIIDVSIEQSGSSINIKNDTAEIRRTGFSFKFKFSQPDTVLVHASFSSETYNKAKAGLPLEELSGFKNTGIVEELFNKDSVIYLSFNSPNFWYYADDKEHKFNSVLKTGAGYLCTRDISGVVDLDGNGEKTDILKIRQNEIYIVIIKIEWNEDYTKMIETNRKILKLKFIL